MEIGSLIMKRLYLIILLSFASFYVLGENLTMHATLTSFANPGSQELIRDEQVGYKHQLIGRTYLKQYRGWGDTLTF